MKCFLFIAFLVSSVAHARSYDYQCFSFSNNSFNDGTTMDLSVNARKASATIHEEIRATDVGGNIDTNYHSRGNVEFVKFGDELIVEKALLSGGKRLRDGSWGGIARVEGQAEGGFYQYKFICKLK